MARHLAQSGTQPTRTGNGSRPDVESFFDRLLGLRDDSWPRADAFAPRMDIAENASEYEIVLEVPGVEANDFNIEFKNGELWITGEKKFEEQQRSDKTYHRVERHYGQFRRVVSLAAPVDESRIKADYLQGVLTITIPKAESAKPKRIPVNV
jgi:HSP20 family protein